MRAKTIIPNTFQEFYDLAPKEIQDYIDRAAKTEQSANWHPEGNVKIHTTIVFNRAKRTGDLNLMIAAFFHDLGKVDVTKKHPTIPGKWNAHGHEHFSARLVQKYRYWIESIGGDYEKVHYIVSQHMRVKQIKDMRRHKQDLFKQHEFYELVNKFSDFDDMSIDYSNDLD